MFVLDTNVISELRKAVSGRANTNVVAWAESIDPIDLYLSAVTILELEFGVLRMEQRDPRQGAMLRNWLDHQVLPEFAERVLPVDTVVARRCAALHVPDPRSDRDAMIAATALVHGMTVVTRNLSDFEPAGVRLLNPWNN
jgi:toxin FitB